MALDTVADYITEARALLQDARTPYRYSDGEIAAAIGLGLYEARRLRPELFTAGVVPSITSATTTGTAVAMDVQYRMSLLYYVVGHISMRDEEEGSDSRGAGYKRMFLAQMLTIAA
jgi:hypothetical protein